MGYYIFRNVLDVREIERGKDSIEDDKVLYPAMINFIQTSIIGALDRHMGWDSVYTKFRVSDDNNSSDASTFHRDILCHDPDKNTYPVYTLLCYLDTTVMEIIPESHKRPIASYREALSTYRKKKQLALNPKDLLLFHSSLLHRGIFTHNATHRRLIQIFELYPTEYEYTQYASRFLHIPVESKRLSKTMISLSKIKPAITILNMFGYLNALTGYGYYSRPLEKFHLQGFTYLSSEGLQERITIPKNGLGDINRYVLQQAVNDLPESYRKRAHFLQYERQFLLYGLTIGLVIILIPIVARFF